MARAALAGQSAAMKPNRIPFALTAIVAGVFASGAPLSASESDDRIETSFAESYVYRTFLKDDSVSTDAKDGVVTLTGTVADESHKALAQDTVAGLPGVKRVENKLETKAEAASGSSDTWIRRKLNLALVFHSHVSANATTIAVKDGIVTLTGEAASSAQRDLTGEYAKDIEGVKEVKNEMTVAAAAEPAQRTAAEKTDDASVTAQIKAALRTHRSTSALKTTIEARHGEVTVSGIAGNAAEKALVGKLVGDVHGVTAVKNQMTVAETKTK